MRSFRRSLSGLWIAFPCSDLGGISAKRKEVCASRNVPSYVRALIGVAAILSGILLAPSASAYCRTYSCDPTRASCPKDPDRPGCLEGGLPLFWPVACVSYALQKDASSQVDFETFRATTAQAFKTWEDAACEGGTMSLAVHDLGPVACNLQEYNQEGGNANVIMFRDTSWPYKNTLDTLALTTLTFSVSTGEIYDADIEIKATPGVVLTTGDTNVNIDLLSVLTHEAGHFLGLAHSVDTKAVMYSNYSPGRTNLRTLVDDDRAAICSVYPPTTAKGACDPTPRHCFSSVCGGSACGDVASSCTLSATPGAAATGRFEAAGALAFVGLAMVTRRYRSKRRAPVEPRTC